MPSLDIRKKGRDKSRRTEWPADSPAITLGRSSTADIILHHTAISRHHCTFEPSGEHWRRRDHQSRHGLKINGVRRSEAILADGDRIHIGPYELIFHAASPAVSGQEIPLDEGRDSAAEVASDESGADGFLSARDAEIDDLRE